MGKALYTKIKTEQAPFSITHETPAIMIGSCFSDNIGNILTRKKFNILKNPLGVLYNPASISDAITRSIKNISVEKEKLIFNKGLWHSYDFHGSFSHHDPDIVVSEANQCIKNTHDFLKQAGVLFVTFGTAWVYRLSESGEIVANCHKLPSSHFTRKRLSVDAIIRNWNEKIEQLKSFNNKLKVVFTVSPVKHLKDGAHENQLSKSTLLLAIDELIKQNPENISYFPSYEIVNDELRDYRFYAEDMAHLSETAVQIIYERFEKTFFSSSTIQLSGEIEKVNKAASHRVLHNNTDEVKKFALAVLKKIETIENNFPFINLQSEKDHFKQLDK